MKVFGFGNLPGSHSNCSFIYPFSVRKVISTFSCLLLTCCLQNIATPGSLSAAEKPTSGGLGDTVGECPAGKSYLWSTLDHTFSGSPSATNLSMVEAYDSAYEELSWFGVSAGVVWTDFDCGDCKKNKIRPDVSISIVASGRMDPPVDACYDAGYKEISFEGQGTGITCALAGLAVASQALASIEAQATEYCQGVDPACSPLVLEQKNPIGEPITYEEQPGFLTCTANLSLKVSVGCAAGEVSLSNGGKIFGSYGFQITCGPNKI